MKVCFISSFYPPLLFGGAEIYVKRIAEKLVQQGLDEVIVISTNSKISVKPSIEEKSGIKIYRIHPINIYAIYNTLNKPTLIKPIWYGIDLLNLHSYTIIRNILIKEKPDIVHIHHFKGFSFAFNAVKSLNLPLILTMHSYFIECPKEFLFRSSNKICNDPSIICRLYAKIQKYLKNDKPDIVTAPSQFMIDKLKKDGFFRGTRTTILPLGIDLTENEKIEKYYQTIDILFVGRLNKYKGLDILIESFKKLNHKNIVLHIVGKGPDMGEFKKIAGSNSNIRFYGFVPERELIELYKKANIVVVPSIWYEVFGLVIIESFKYGTPVVGSDIGAIPELIENGHNGYLFEAGSVAELKKVLENLLENSSELKRLSENAFESVKKYNMDEHIQELKKLYEEALVESRRRNDGT